VTNLASLPRDEAGRLIDASAAQDLSGLRIAFISGNYNCLRDGANRAQNELVRYLLDRGAHVRVYSPTCEEPAFPPTGDLVSVPSLPMLFGRKEYRMALRLGQRARDDIIAFAPNLFHISLPFFHGKGALALARELDVPVVAAMHTRFETYPAYYGLGFLVPALMARLRSFYTRCDRIVAPCESAARTLEEQGMGKQVGIWSRGVDTQIFSPASRDMAWRRAIGIEDQDLVIAFLGRLVLEKGLDEFASTIERVCEAGYRPRIMVIGDGPARAEFETRLDKCELDKAVFVGFQHGPELGRALASCDLLLNPSATEAFGNVSLEAMACGLPVIAADASGNSDIIVDAVTGRLVQPRDIEGYASAVRTYLDDPQLRLEHGRAALVRSGEFTWDNANAAIVATYLSALAEKHPNAGAVARIAGA